MISKYVHIKACLATVYVPRSMRQVKMIFIPVTGNVNYTQTRAYCPFSLLAYIQKMMQKFETRNVREETLGNVPYIYMNLLQTREAHINHNAPCDCTYTGSSGKQEVTIEFS
jgi:hypothetical protein